MLLKALRMGLGKVIIVADFVTRPRKTARSPEAQAAVDAAASRLTLYQFQACPFCVKVRRELHRLNVPIALRDAKNNPQDRKALLEEGGRIKVPCLRIDDKGSSTWLYESSAINAYLHEHFGGAHNA